MMKKRTLDDIIKEREKLDKKYWTRIEELQDEWDELMKEEDSK